MTKWSATAALLMPILPPVHYKFFALLKTTLCDPLENTFHLVTAFVIGILVNPLFVNRTSKKEKFYLLLYLWKKNKNILWLCCALTEITVQPKTKEIFLVEIVGNLFDFYWVGMFYICRLRRYVFCKERTFT